MPASMWAYTFTGGPGGRGLASAGVESRAALADAADAATCAARGVQPQTMPAAAASTSSAAAARPPGPGLGPPTPASKAPTAGALPKPTNIKAAIRRVADGFRGRG